MQEAAESERGRRTKVIALAIVVQGPQWTIRIFVADAHLNGGARNQTNLIVTNQQAPPLSRYPRSRFLTLWERRFAQLDLLRSSRELNWVEFDPLISGAMQSKVLGASDLRPCDSCDFL